ncbi:MAG: hypothetical protein ACLQJR_27195 [Stellaceae bacterium]
MKGLLIASAIALGLGAAAAQAGPAADLIQGTAVFAGSGYRFVELTRGADTLVCAKDDLPAGATIEKGRQVQFSGRFANYAGLYQQVMMLAQCDIRPLPQS